MGKASYSEILALQEKDWDTFVLDSRPPIFIDYFSLIYLYIILKLQLKIV